MVSFRRSSGDLPHFSCILGARSAGVPSTGKLLSLWIISWSRSSCLSESEDPAAELAAWTVTLPTGAVDGTTRHPRYHPGAKASCMRAP